MRSKQPPGRRSRLRRGAPPGPDLAVRAVGPAFFATAIAALAFALSAALLGTSGCSRSPPDATPESAVRLLLDDMDSAGDDPASTRRAYALLGPSARANLSERARRTSELLGRHIEPWEMLAAGFFGVAFRPMSMRSTVVGDRAIVDVFGEDPRGEHATVSCIREGLTWKIEPSFPPP